MFKYLGNFSLFGALITRGQVSDRDMSFVQAIYLLSLTDSEVPFTARVYFPKSFQALCSLARIIRE